MVSNDAPRFVRLVYTIRHTAGTSAVTLPIPRCSLRLCQSACFPHLTGIPIERYTAVRRLEFGAIFIVHGFHADVAQLAEQAPCKR